MSSSQYHHFLVAIVPLALFNFMFVISLFVYIILRRRGRVKDDEELLKRGDSAFIGMWMRQWWLWVIRPITNFFIRNRINPDVITTASVILAVAAGVAYYYGEIALGGWITLIYGTLDLIDGRVARETGQATRSGAFLDSVLDRYSEFFTYTGILLHHREGIFFYVVLLMIIGSFMVSYTRARGEALGVSITHGIMQRPERIVYLGICSALSPLLTYALSFYMHNPPEYLYLFALLLIAVFANYTALQRLFYGYRVLKTTPPEQKT